MKKITISIIIILISSLSACNNAIEGVMEGFWTIDTLEYRGYDVKQCVYTNMIIFKKDKEFLISGFNHYCEDIIKQGSDDTSFWEIIKSEGKKDSIPYRIKVFSLNEVFNGIHKIVFHRDEVNKLLKAEIWSDSLYIVCRKGLFNYDGNIKLIRSLEKKTWTTRPG